MGVSKRDVKSDRAASSAPRHSEDFKRDDWIFLSATPFLLEHKDIEFEGAVGLVQGRDRQTALALPSAGRLKTKEQLLDKSRQPPQGGAVRKQ